MSPRPSVAGLFLLGLLALAGCDRVKNTARRTVHKTGEVVGSTATVLADGVGEGAQRAAIRVELSPALQGRGLALGKISTGTAEATPKQPRPLKRLSMYVIFNQPFADSVTVKLFGSDNLEYGRRRTFLKGRAADAHSVDVLFDERTDFELGTRVVVE